MTIKPIIAGALLLSSLAVAPVFAQTSELRLSHLESTLLNCMSMPMDRVDRGDAISISFVLDAEGDLSERPVLRAPKVTTSGERAILRQVQFALVNCTPVPPDSTGYISAGTFGLVAKLDSIVLSLIAPNIAAPEVVVVGASDDAVQKPFLTIPTDASSESSEAFLNLSRSEKRVIQRRLVVLGHNTNGVDGIFGAGSRSAISDWQLDNEMSTTGYFNAEQLAYLNEVSEEEYQAWQAAEAARPKRYRDRNGCLREANGRIITGRSFGCNLSAAAQELGL